ncbi:MAG: hypothetical protein MI784_02710 [Cytophagales bacterium]|nr:hypothetical protein [Cytophagales bacterium]
MKTILKKIVSFSIIAFFSPNKKKEIFRPSLPEKKTDKILGFEFKSRYSRRALQLLLHLSPLRPLKVFLRTGIEIHRISYITHFKGKEIIASGLVCIPKDVDPQKPIVCGLRSTIFAHKFAPSEINPFYGLELFCAAGYITFIPDLLGMGTSKHILPPFHHKESASSSVIDFILAGQELLSFKQLPIQNNLFLFGYSEGGYSALAAQEAIENDKDLKLQVEAVSAGAGAYHLTETMQHIFSQDSHATPCLLSYLFYSYHHLYDWADSINHIFSKELSDKLHELFDGKKTIEEVNSGLSVKLRDLFRHDFLKSVRQQSHPQVLHAFQENSVHNYTPLAPLRLYHSKKDQTIPYTDSIATYRAMKKRGARNISLHYTQPKSHAESVFEMAQETLRWFDSMCG